jgi:hypothetical protein
LDARLLSFGPRLSAGGSNGCRAHTPGMGRLPQPKLNMTVAARTVGGQARRPETTPANEE